MKRVVLFSLSLLQPTNDLSLSLHVVKGLKLQVQFSTLKFLMAPSPNVAILELEDWRSHLPYRTPSCLDQSYSKHLCRLSMPI